MLPLLALPCSAIPPAIPVLSNIFDFGPLLLFPFLRSSFTVLVNNNDFPIFSILFSGFRSCSRSKKPKNGHLHPHPKDACDGPAPAAPAMPSPISTALEHSLCLEETCGQNHLLLQQEHFHRTVKNTNTKDCKKTKKTLKKQKKTPKPKQTKVKGCQERRLSSLQSTEPVAHRALLSVLPNQGLVPFLSLMCHVHPDSSFSPKDVCCCQGCQAG